ncbi:MAG TPA: hypothetical protein VN922_15425 [Bacteroidia bacterium]|nr:hypothetical protein [Bacteroidia bacterium]
MSKNILTTIALAMLSLSAFSQQREMTQTQRPEAAQQMSSYPQQSYQQYTEPQRQVTPAQSYQQAAPQYTPPSNPQINNTLIATDHQSNSGKTNSSEHCSDKDKHDKRTHADMTKPLVEPIGTACNNVSPALVNCVDNEMQLVYICPFCGRLYYKGGYCPYDSTELVSEYVDSRGISR